MRKKRLNLQRRNPYQPTLNIQKEDRQINFNKTKMFNEQIITQIDKFNVTDINLNLIFSNHREKFRDGLKEMRRLPMAREVIGEQMLQTANDRQQHSRLNQRSVCRMLEDLAQIKVRLNNERNRTQRARLCWSSCDQTAKNQDPNSQDITQTQLARNGGVSTFNSGKHEMQTIKAIRQLLAWNVLGRIPTTTHYHYLYIPLYHEGVGNHKKDNQLDQVFSNEETIQLRLTDYKMVLAGLKIKYQDEDLKMTDNKERIV
ncbi:hypothetical protein OXYTRIMIC_192 [Oxytricha trifallax]|uniref:Uncharacterized protein n=1 Tax=Oxytricha trifallax TaxID=1172189 RepID=A0A073HZQ9_9SPIT|nr:hypothetical protein OXYTRIMIC_192 [Oxytricha trifallax]